MTKTYKSKSGYNVSDVEPAAPQSEAQKAALLDGKGRTIDPSLVPTAVAEYISAHCKLDAAATGEVVRELFGGPLTAKMVEKRGASWFWNLADGYIGQQYAARARAARQEAPTTNGLHIDLAGKMLPVPKITPTPQEQELIDAGLGEAVERAHQATLLPFYVDGSVAQRRFRARCSDGRPNGDNGFNFYGVPTKQQNRLLHELLGVEHLSECEGKYTEEEAYRRVIAGLDARFNRVSRTTAKEDNDMAKTATPPVDLPKTDPEVARQAQLKGQWKALISHLFPDESQEQGGALMLDALNYNLDGLGEPLIAKLSEWPFGLDDVEGVVDDWRQWKYTVGEEIPEDYDQPVPAVNPIPPSHSEALATCYPSDPVIYKGFRFNISLRAGGHFSDFQALMDEYIAAHKAGIIQLTPAPQTAPKPPVNGAKQGQGAASRPPTPTGTPAGNAPAASGPKERESQQFVGVTRILGTKGEWNFSLATMYNGSESKYPQNVTKSKDCEVFQKAMAQAFGEEYAGQLDLGTRYAISGTVSWTPGAETKPGSGKFWRDNMTFAFDDAD